MKVLSVEDSRINQTIITERLKMRGYEVIQAFDGNEAIAILNNEVGIELALLDIGLPYKSGIELAQFMKSSEQLNSIPIIFLTAHATKEYRDEASKVGVDDFFSKPIDFKALFNRIQAILPNQ
jgi:DNA-binding response OmpR family regulator